MSTETTASGNVTLRAACSDDLTAILSLLEGAGLTLAGVSDGLVRLIVAEVGNELVGVAGLERYGTSALLRSVAVSPRYQGMGIAGAMVQRLLLEAQCECIKDVYLRTTTAERYFPKFGFRSVSVSQVPLEVRDSVEFQGACPASAVTMVCCMEDEATRAL